MKHALVVVDMQNDFVSGSLGSEAAQAIVPHVKQLVSNFSGKVFFTRDTHDNNYLNSLEGQMLPIEHCIDGTDGWNVINELDSITCDKFYIDKITFGYNNWFGTFIGYLGIDCIAEGDFDIIICGLCTDICVISNALLLRAAFPDVHIYLDAAGCAGTTPDKHRAAIEAMKSCQIEIINEEAE